MALLAVEAKLVKTVKVPSEGTGSLGAREYLVKVYDNGYMTCGCEDYAYRSETDPRHVCKHMLKA